MAVQNFMSRDGIKRRGGGSDLNIQWTLSRELVNMSMVPKWT